MTTFREAVSDSLGSALCAVIALNDDGAKLFGGVPGLNKPADYFNFFAPLRAQFCNDDPATTPTPPPQFSGGQCDTGYTVSYEVRSRPSSQFNCGTFGDWGTVTTVIPSAIIQGPIGPVRTVTEPFDDGFNNADTTVAYRFTAANGEFSLNLGGAGGRSYWAACGVGFEYRNFSVTRLDGQPDACGDPDIVPVEPGPVERPISVTYDTDNNTTINLNGTVRFGPYFSTGDFNLRVPFTLDLGGLNWNGNLEITPEFKLTIAPRINFGSGGVTDGPPPDLTPDPNDTVPAPEYENEPLIVGVVVRGEQDSLQYASSIAADGMPTIKAPRCGSVSFAIERSLTVSWTPDIDVKNLDCYIPCPEPRGAVGVAVTAAPGFRLGWTPVRGQPLT